MEYKLLYYVAVPMTEEILDLITLFSIKASVDDTNTIAAKICGLFLYNDFLVQEHLCTATE